MYKQIKITKMKKKTMQFIIFFTLAMISILAVSINIYHLIFGNFGDYTAEYFLAPINLYGAFFSSYKLWRLSF